MDCTFKKIYVHHYYTKSLFYKLAHNTIDRIHNIKNEIKTNNSFLDLVISNNFTIFKSIESNKNLI
jgi:hypothetical protein